MTDDSCTADQPHAWEFHIADKTTPYHFCRKCKSTLYNGRVYVLNP